jgi:hypothetical protein
LTFRLLLQSGFDRFSAYFRQKLHFAACLLGVKGNTVQWKVLLLGAALLGGCASWRDVHLVCQNNATRVLLASGQLPPEMQQANYQNAYRQCVAAYGFTNRLPPSP